MRRSTAPDGVVPRRLPRLTAGVFTDLAVWMIGLGLATGVLFPLLALLLGVPASQAITVSFFAATLAAGVLVGGVNFLLARSVVGDRLRLLSRHMGLVGEMVGTATSSGDWSACDAEACAIPIDSDDEIGESAAAFNELVRALERSHGMEAAVRDLLGVMSSHIDLVALSDAALTGLLHHLGGGPGAVVVDLEHEPTITAARGVSCGGRLADAPGLHDALRARRPRVICVDGEAELVATPIEFESRALGCIVLPPPRDADAERLIALFARAFGVALNNAVAHAGAQRLASVDTLTGAASRRAGMLALEHETDRAAKERRDLSVLMIDLDHFKRINDRHGHLVGDRVLHATAEAIRRCLRPSDTLVRYGGEEFLVVLCEVGPGVAPEAAERIGAAIRSDVVAGVRTTASIGWAALAGDETPSQLLERADRALYHAKEAGRDRVAPAGVMPSRATSVAGL